MEELKLHGMWASPFSLMAEIALKLSNIPYTYEEENLQEKSESLLKYNPIHKKVPVLVHNGKPIVESFVILEYIDETWKDSQLLPSDPYERARARFWIAFLYDKFLPRCKSIVLTQGIEQEKAIKDSMEHLRTFEEGTGKEFSTEARFFHGNVPGMLDIVFGSNLRWYGVLTELSGIELVDKEKTPILCERLKAFEEVNVVKEKLPQHEKLMAYAESIRNKVLGSN